MEESIDNRNNNSRIPISRNTPIAFIVGVAGFLGSHLAEQLVKKNIQVIGIDDFSQGSRHFLDNLTSSKNFHLINSSIVNTEPLEKEILSLPRLDYAFFVADGDEENFFDQGVLAFLKLIREFRDLMQDEDKKSKTISEKPKVIFVSSIKLYDNKLDDHEQLFKEAEIKFAKFVKYYKLNARIVRLASIYGPRMHFRENDPAIRLLQASLSGSLQNENITTEFSSRAIFISDAVNLVIKATLSGGTSHNIYDGARITPIKVDELKQILLDPLWHESRGFKESELPPWPSPNLKKTMRELNWKINSDLIDSLKETIIYFKENDIEVQAPKEDKSKIKDVPVSTFAPSKKWSFYTESEETPAEKEKTDKNTSKESLNKGGVRSKIVFFIILAVICYGLVLPIISLGVGAFTIRGHINESRVALEKGDFAKAEREVLNARTTLKDAKIILGSTKLIASVGILDKQINALNSVVTSADNSLDGIAEAISGSQKLFQTTKIVVGEEKGDSKKLFSDAETKLNSASQKIAKSEAQLKNPETLNNLPGIFRGRVEDLSIKLDSYEEMVEKMRTASILLPEIIGLDGSKKSYLILFQNNLELRAGGGFIGSYGVLSFENGKLTGIKVDDIYNLDGTLGEVITPPDELKNDLNIDRLFLRDSNYEADFSTNARLAETLYKKETGQQVNGVIAVDLSGSGKILNSVGGVELSDYNETVDGSNLFERAITHAEVNFFPGSQSKKNYLTALQSQLFNKVFYLSRQNWPAIIQAVGAGLEQKHILVYLSDSNIFSYLTAENWAGVIPRGGEQPEGSFNDFLAMSESNMGANKSNFYLERKIRLDTSIGKEGQIYHILAVNYKNNSPSEVFPAGKYKNRFKIYLPVGSKLTKAVLGERDITSAVSTFSDYGRTGYSVLIEILPKDQKTLVLEYNLDKGLTFKGKVADYRLNVIKQPGTGNDPFDWNLTYPINMEAQNNQITNNNNQEINIATDLLMDRSFSIKFIQK